jgi:hypothetical protein
MTYRRWFTFCLYILPVLPFLLCPCSQLMAADISLAWDASVSPEVTGYNIYVGNSSGTYGAPITIGNQTTYTVTGLTSGTYYIVATAFDALGNESAFSNEVSQVIAASAPNCDLNGDASINVLDLQLLANVILAISSGGYDLNGDGSVNVLDLQILNNVVLGLRNCQ